MAVAVLEEGRYAGHAPQPVGDVSTLLERISSAAGGASVLAGFDFPIGVPAAYAQRAGIRDFRTLLPLLGRGEWARFYDVAEDREEIEVRRPFYPRSSLLRGSKKRQHLFEGLGVASMSELLRRCDRAQGGRREAASMFWLIGGNQVGRAAISGWREVLVLALRSPDVALWPFDGGLDELLASKRVVIAETYPAEFYNHLGLRFGSKRRQEDRVSTAPTLLRWAEDNAVTPTAEMHAAIEDGFGGRPDGEDRFDAAIGPFGMLGVVLGSRRLDEPRDAITNVEGWILGQHERQS